MRESTILITGTPRSGTTLICHLLNLLQDTVALHEPIRGAQVRQLEQVGDVVERFCTEQRRSILEHKRAPSKQTDGAVPDNSFRTIASEAGRREKVVSRGEIVISKELSSEFVLAIKQPGIFTATLDQLAGRFPVYAIVRNPLATIASWNSVDLVVRSGHFAVAERFDPALRERLAALDDALERQVCLLDWFHAQFWRYLPETAILRYEAIVASGGKALAVMHPGAAALAEPLANRNRSELYDRELMLKIGERLLESDGAYWASYTRGDVESLLAELSEPVTP